MRGVPAPYEARCFMGIVAADLHSGAPGDRCRRRGVIDRTKLVLQFLDRPHERLHILALPQGCEESSLVAKGLDALSQIMPGFIIEVYKISRLFHHLPVTAVQPGYRKIRQRDGLSLLSPTGRHFRDKGPEVPGIKQQPGECPGIDNADSVLPRLRPQFLRRRGEGNQRRTGSGGMAHHLRDCSGTENIQVPRVSKRAEDLFHPVDQLPVILQRYGTFKGGMNGAQTADRHAHLVDAGRQAVN